MSNEIDSTILYSDLSSYQRHIVISFDKKERLVILQSDKSEDLYMHISRTDVAALKRVLDRQCKPRAKTGDQHADILEMMNFLFGNDKKAFERIADFLIEYGIPYTSSRWMNHD